MRKASLEQEKLTIEERLNQSISEKASLEQEKLAIEERTASLETAARLYIPAESAKQEGAETTSSEPRIEGKQFVILGTLVHISREKAKMLIEEAGGKIINSPTAKVDYIVVGKAPGEKLRKSQRLGIRQLSETQFLSILELIRGANQDLS